MKQLKNKQGTLIRKETRWNNGNKYEYSLFVKKSPRVASFGLNLYSIIVSVQSPNGEGYEEKINEGFSNFAHAGNFFESLVTSLASPSELPYMYDKALNENRFDGCSYSLTKYLDF